MVDLSIMAVDAAGLRRCESALHPIYRQCFSAPPYNESAAELDDFPARLARDAGHPGAYGFVAEHDGEVLGAVYGWPALPALPKDNEFDVAVRSAVPSEWPSCSWHRVRAGCAAPPSRSLLLYT